MALAFKRSLTVDHTLCGTADSTSFTVLFRSPTGTVNTAGTAVTLATGDNFPTWLTDSIMINGVVYTISAWLTSSTLTLGSSAGTQTGVAYCGTPWAATAANGGKVQSSGGSPARPYDLEFFSDSGLTSPLSGWEVVNWSATTGSFEIWSIVGTLTHSSDLVFYVGYDDAGVGSYQGGSTGAAWASLWQSRWHFPDGTTLGLSDSTSNTNNLTNTGASAIAGKIDGGISLNGTTNHADSSMVVNYSGLTISGWWSKPVNGSGRFIANSHTDVDKKGFQCIWQDGTTSNFYLQGNFGNGSSQTQVNTGDIFSGGPSASGFHHIVFTYDGANVRLYFDSVLKDTQALTGSISASGVNVSLGRNPAYNGDYWAGTGDEVGIGNSAISQSWITSEYNNQSSPHTFITVGAETATGGGGGLVGPLVGQGHLIGGPLVGGRLIRAA